MITPGPKTHMHTQNHMPNYPVSY